MIEGVNLIDVGGLGALVLVVLSLLRLHNGRLARMERLLMDIRDALDPAGGKGRKPKV